MIACSNQSTQLEHDDSQELYQTLEEQIRWKCTAENYRYSLKTISDNMTSQCNSVPHISSYNFRKFECFMQEIYK